MGLDMYLYAKKHYSNYDFRPEEREINKQVKQAIGLDHITADDAYVQVTVNVGYWRKANQIHDWFVKNVQGGTDDCKEYYVPRDDLQRLLDTVNNALKTRDATELPPCQGFFFGSTAVDDYYWDDLEHTSSLLTQVINDKNLSDSDIYYQSSW